MMNERSSRAHSILILSLKQRNLRTGVEIESKMFLADLGGSEQIKKSKVSWPSCGAVLTDSPVDVNFT